MQTPETPVVRDIVLVGGGHSHAVLLRRWAMRPLPGVRLTLICRDTHTPYSGMLPGHIAGHYSFEQVHIDLRTLAQAAGARFFRSEVIALDRSAGQVLCEGRPPVPYDWVSINIGATPRLGVPGAASHALPVKPIDRFHQRWLELLARVRTHSGKLRLAVVGAGAGGVELLLAMQWRLRAELKALSRDPDALEFHLYSSTAQILPSHNARVQRHFTQVLRQRGVQLHTAQAVTEVWAGCLQTASGQVFDADAVIWVTQVTGAPWLRETGLALDEAGFIRVNENLQSISDERVFAAGDVASWPHAQLEKAGVFAVRQAMPLMDNLRRSLLAEPLRPYRPQRRWLGLISTGDANAVASRGRFFAQGPWVWRWKDWIDRRFMAQFEQLPATMAQTSVQAPALPLEDVEREQLLSAQAMRCGGCGAKVSASVLARVLARLQPRPSSDVLLGLSAGDDAAVLRLPPGQALVQSVDFFRAFIDDPYVFGRIAANHALGDVFAMGAQAHSALALATVPPGLESRTEDLLLQMMSGALSVLDAADCALVGGHTGEGQELALGFSVNGLVAQDLQGLMSKAGLQPGDSLILTKPIGTGTLLVAHQKLCARGHWIDAALQTMMQSSQQAAQVLRAHGARACTDLTGFGLLGHLLEMSRPSGVDLRLQLSALPVLAGAAESAAAGHLSSLHASNAQMASALQSSAACAGHPHLPLLFDPQTAGGLLAGVPAAQSAACLRALHAQGYTQACVIGQVLACSQTPQPVQLVV
jgi:selenide,water dikinase